MTLTLDDWLDAAQTNAERRQLPALGPLLTALADATRALRDAEWNHHAASRPAPETPQPDDTPTT